MSCVSEELVEVEGYARQFEGRAGAQTRCRDSPVEPRTNEEYLHHERGKVFPENFYTFLQQISRSPPMTTDQKIQRIHHDLGHLESLLVFEDPGERIDGGCLVIVTNVVVSCVHSLQLTPSKIACLEVLGWLAERLTSDLILERLLPQLIHFLTSAVPSVVSTAVSVLVSSLGHVTFVPRSEAKTFPGYILPVLSPLAKHRSVSVRCALARHLAALASLASKWLDMVISAYPPDHAATEYHSELSTLHKNFEDLVTALLEDSNTSHKRDDSNKQDNSVKQVLVNESAAKLAVWLGRQKAVDVLLSHMVVSRTISAISDLVTSGLLEKVAVFGSWQSRLTKCT